MPPPWLIASLISLFGVVLAIVLPRLTTKGLSTLASDVKTLKENVWTVEEKIDLAERLTKIESAVRALEGEVNFTKTSHGEFLRLLEKALIPTAHSPHTPELDELLEKRYREEELSAAEWKKLIQELGEQANNSKLPGKQVALNGLRAIYLTYMRRAQHREEEAMQNENAGLHQQQSNG